MEHLTLAILTFSILAATICWWSWQRKKPKTTNPLPPGPRGVPILGYLPFFKSNLHRQFNELAHEYGPIYRLWCGSKLTIIISSPSLIKEVVRDQDSILANRDTTMAGMVATHGRLNIVASDYGPYWRNMRKLFVREMMSNNNLDASYGVRKDEMQRTVQDVRSKIGKAIDIGKLVFVTELNVIMSLLWGSTVPEEKRDQTGAEFPDWAAKFVDLLETPNISDFFPSLAKFDIQGIAKEMAGILPSIEEIFDYAIKERVKDRATGGKEETKDVLQVMLDYMDEQVDGPITHTHIRSILMDIVIGGTDTSATIVEWAMAEILNTPGVLEKLQEELANVVGPNNKPEESHIPELHYLDAVLRESFRLHPPLPLLIPRRPSQSCIIGGYSVPKDCRVILNAWYNYRDPQIWENPNEFRPERFLDDTGKWDYQGTNFMYLPFGSGRRVCPGLPLAEKMVMYLLATLLHLFDWKLPEGTKLDMSEKFGIVTKKTEPLFAVPSQRLADEIYEMRWNAYG